MFQDSSFKFQVSGFGIRDSGRKLQVLKGAAKVHKKQKTTDERAIKKKSIFADYFFKTFIENLF